MDRHVAVAHYPEGAGHATRMLAVAHALEARGASVSLAGGGPGAKFVDIHGHDQFEPAMVDYIDDFQDGGNLLRVLTNSVPTSAKRVVDYVRWLRRVDPDAILTDDMFAAMAAPIARTPLYVLTHNAPGFYDECVEQWFTWLLTEFQLHAGQEFFYPAVWPAIDEEPAGVTRVPPIALEAPETAADGVELDTGAQTVDSGDGSVDGEPRSARSDGGRVNPDVLCVPSHYSRGFESLVDRLNDGGHNATLVGGDDWEPVPALLPVIERADAVVCSGYSTIMEAAVAGTPCVIYPFTDEQRGVGRVIDRAGVEGFAVVDRAETVGEALESLSDPEPFENGAGVIAESLLADL
ncbi:MAG: glycosyltransferase [Halolamina sp.]